MMSEHSFAQNDMSREIWELDKRHVLHPWVHFDSFENDGALIVESGDGSTITDLNGQTYLDAVGGLWCNNIGLGRDDMAQAIAEQVRKLAYSSPFVDMGSSPAALLAAKIAERAPGDLNRIQFTTGGSTAVDSAYRMMHFYQACSGHPDKTHVITRKGGYHGSTYASMSIGHKKADRAPEFKYIEDTIHQISTPNYYRAPDGMNEAGFLDFLVREFEDKIAEVGPERVGGFFAEPVMGAGGVIVPPKGYHKRFKDICETHDILYVSDEVVTAFGRLGHWFASEDEFDIVPDIITSAKGITSGYLPLGAVIYSDRIHNVISKGDPDRWYTSGFTYTGHPVCCAAALKNIEIIENEAILQHAKDVGTYFEQRLHDLNDLPLVGNVRGKKLMMCVENVRDKKTKELLPDEVNIGKRIANTCEEMGLIVRPIGHLNVMSPPLIITRDEVDFVVETLGKGIAKVTDDLARSGDL